MRNFLIFSLKKIIFFHLVVLLHKIVDKNLRVSETSNFLGMSFQFLKGYQDCESVTLHRVQNTTVKRRKRNEKIREGDMDL